MTELINKATKSSGVILDKSINFIFKNILWIAFIGFTISIPELYLEQWALSKEIGTSVGILKYKIIFRLISIILAPVLTVTVTILIGEQFFGRNMSWHQGFRKSFKKWIPILFLQLGIGIAVGLGSILLVVPGIIVMCATACAIPAMVLENLGPIKAFSRSWHLTKNNRFRIFGFSCLSVLTMTFAGGIPLALTMGIHMATISKVMLSAIIIAPFQALWPAIATFLFLEFRKG